MHQVLAEACRILSCGMRNLVPWSGIEPRIPTLGVWHLIHWSTSEVAHLQLWARSLGIREVWWSSPPLVTFSCTSDQQYICIGRLVGLPHYLLRGFVSNFFICMDFWILFHYPGGHLIFLGNCWLSWAQSICPRPNMRNARVSTKRQPYHRTTACLSLQRVVASVLHHGHQRSRLQSFI